MGTIGDSCWTKIPYASIFALLVLLAGIGSFCGPFYMGLDDLEVFLRDRNALNLNKENEILWLGELKILLTIAGAVTGVIGMLLVVFGALATGATRRNVYSGAKCIMGGRCSSVFFMAITYIFNFIWMAITSAMSIPLIFFLMMRSICNSEFTYQKSQPGVAGKTLYCFNLTRIGVYFPGYSPEFPDQFSHGPAICDQGTLTKMCGVVAKEIPLMIAAFVGAFLIVISLVSFLMIVSVNYQRIKTAKELTDYRDALEQDTTEMDNIITSRRPFNSSYASESVLT